MKLFLSILILATSMQSWAVSPNQNKFSDENEILSFWDGTFAYNTMRITEHRHQDNIITIYLSGSTLGIGQQMANVGDIWEWRSLVRVTLRKDSCKVIDVAAKTIDCDQPNRVAAEVTWHENPAILRTLDWSIQNIKIKADDKQVMMSFGVAPNEYFKPTQQVLGFKFPVSPFQ